MAYEAYFVNNAPITYFSSQSASSTVYVENGVSGIVTITDPSLQKTVQFDINYYPLETGSGVIVSKDGYIITAFHVVGDPKANAQNMLRKLSDSDIKRYVEQAAVSAYLSNYNPKLGAGLLNNTNNNAIITTQSSLNESINATTELLIQNNLISATSYRQVIKVRFPASVGINPLNAQLIDVGNSGTDADIALLKVDPAAGISLPSLNISSQNPEIGENVRIYGYPASSNVTQNQSSVTPSTTTGRITAEVPNSQGTIYYRANASTFPGYSGGPVLNSKNEIIGILVYGLESKGRFINQVESKSSLFLSPNYIIQICNKNNVPLTVV